MITELIRELRYVAAAYDFLEYQLIVDVPELCARAADALEDERCIEVVRGAGCQCGDDEACAFLVRAEKAEEMVRSLSAQRL